MKMRVAIISDHASPLATLGGVDAGGQNIYVGHVAKNLVAMGHEVDVFTRRDGDLPLMAYFDGVRVIHVPAGPASAVRKEDIFPFLSDFCAFMVDFINKNGRYDVVHANFWMSGYVADRLKRIFSIPFVITFHALGHIRRMHQRLADRFPIAREKIEERLVQVADRIIAECPQDREDLLHFYKADSQKISVVPCGFDPAEVSPLNKGFARFISGFSPKEKILLQLGRMVPRKGVDTVIRTLARVRHVHNLAVKLLVVGGEFGQPDERAEMERLKQIAQNENVSEHVVFRGKCDRSELQTFYSAADLFLTLPWYEPFGITPLEAMACGTPVIGSNVGGIKFSVVDGQTGYLVPAKDPDAAATCVAAFYARPELARKFGRQAIDRVNKLFTWSSVSQSIENIYDMVLGRVQQKSIGERRRAARL